jgi:hypothetical protein
MKQSANGGLEFATILNLAYIHFEVFAAFWMLCMDSLATAAFGRIAVRTDEPNKLRSPNA